jgi:transcription initiation factor TFIIB
LVIVEENTFINNYCPECKGYIVFIEEKGDSVCSQCGLIINEREFDTSHSEKRAYTRDEKSRRERTGILISPLISDLALCTIINNKNVFNPDLKRAIKRDSYLNWKDRNFLIAATELKRLGSLLSIPSYVLNVALKLYKKAYNNNLLKGRTIKGMAAACLYYACRNEKIPRNYHEILKESPIGQKTISKCYKSVCSHFNLKLPSTDPLFFIPKYIALLGLNNEVEQLTIKIIQNYLKHEINNGKNPKGLIAGAIYLASKLKNAKITQKDISSIINITEVTLRSRYKEIIKKVDIFSLNQERYNF